MALTLAAISGRSWPCQVEPPSWVPNTWPLRVQKYTLLRRTVVYGDAEGGAGRLDALVKPAPAVAAVRGAKDATLFAAEVQADTGVKSAGVVGRDLYATGVADVGVILELEVVPGLAAVAGAPHASPVGDEHGLVDANGYAVQV